MRTLKIFALMAVSAGISLSSCQKNDSEILTTSESNSLSVQLQAVNNTYSFGVGTRAVAAGTLKWDTCQMYVSKIHLTATKEQGDTLSTEFTVELKYKGSKFVDLFSASSLLGDTQIQSGVYDKVKIRIQSDKRDSKNSPVFYLSGKYTNTAETVTPIAVVVNEPIDFAVTAKDSVAINLADDYIALFQLDLSSYINNSKLTADDLDKAKTTNGIIIISETSNSELYSKFFKRVSLQNAIKHKEFKKGKEKNDNNKD